MGDDQKQIEYGLFLPSKSPVLALPLHFGDSSICRSETKQEQTAQLVCLIAPRQQRGSFYFTGQDGQVLLLSRPRA